MKKLCGIGCVLSMCGIIWGVFYPACLWLVAIGLACIVFAGVFMDEN